MVKGEPVVAERGDGWQLNWDARVQSIIEEELVRFGIILPDEKVPPKELPEIYNGGSYTSHKPDLPRKGAERFQVPVVVLVELIAHAIATFEGFYLQKSDPSVAQRFNNPGNLRSWGDVPIGYVAGGGPGYAKFPTTQEGWRALRLQVWKNIVNRGMTLITFFERYAPSSDNNRPIEYAEFVERYLKDRGIVLLVHEVIRDQGANIQDKGASNKSKIGYPGLFDVPLEDEEKT